MSGEGQLGHNSRVKHKKGAVAFAPCEAWSPLDPHPMLPHHCLCHGVDNNTVQSTGDPGQCLEAFLLKTGMLLASSGWRPECCSTPTWPGWPHHCPILISPKFLCIPSCHCILTPPFLPSLSPRPGPGQGQGCARDEVPPSGGVPV